MTERICANPKCGKNIPKEKRVDAIYCSDKCRQHISAFRHSKTPKGKQTRRAYNRRRDRQDYCNSWRREDRKRDPEKYCDRSRKKYDRNQTEIRKKAKIRYDKAKAALDIIKQLGIKL